MSVITKDLGVATAYGYAKSKGYTGTEEEFAELMASYADVAQQAEASAQDAEDAKDAAITAKTAAQTAQTAAESAQAAAAGSAQTASTKATEASNSAQTAAGSATAAGDSATTAQTAAQTATTKASEASSSASAASTAKTGAETARTGAQTAQTAAETAQANAEAAASSVSASAAQIEQNTEDIAGLKNDLSDGTFIVNNAENAEQLTSTVGVEDKTPYLFRTSGGSVDIGDRETVGKIVGGTIVNNQLTVIPYTVTKNGITFTNNNDGSITINGTATSVVYEKFSDTVPSITGHVYYLDKGANGSFAFYNDVGGVDTGIAGRVGIGKATADKYFYYYIANGTTIDNVTAFPQLTDLTQDFGTAIADYVYNLEQATAGAGVAWLKKHFPKQFDSGYQAYDAGSLQSVSGLTEHRMVGFNQWDEVWEAYGSVQIKSKNRIRLFGGVTYYAKTPSVGITLYFKKNKDDVDNIGQITVVNNTFVVPSNANYAVMYTGANYGNVYNHDICINLHWDGERDGEYEPYQEWVYPLDDSLTLRGIPKLDTNNQLYYDGDEYLPDGTVNRRYGIVDLGTLTWQYSNVDKRFCNTTLPFKPATNTGTKLNVICVDYQPISLNAFVGDLTVDNTISSTGIYLFIRNLSYTTADAFKTAMSGVMLVYELATPATETADPYQETQIVDDFGTEEFVLAEGAFPVPVGHETYYKSNLRAKLEMAPDSPDSDGLYVVQQESGENTYVPLASTATIQDILTRLTALENA